MSSQDISPRVLPGYKTQCISTKPTGSGSGYIKQKVLVKWLKQHESQVGPRWDYAIGDDVIVLAIRNGGDLSTNDIVELQKHSTSQVVTNLFDEHD